MKGEEPAIKPYVYTGSLYESQTGQLDDRLIEKLEGAFNQVTSQVMLYDVARIASEYDPIDLAHAAIRLPLHAREVLYSNLPDGNAKAIFLINTSSNTRTGIFRHLSDEQILDVLKKMPAVDAVWILDDVSDRRYKRLMEIMDAKMAARIHDLQKHDRESAARLMTDEFYAFPLHATIGDVAKRIRQNPGIDPSGRVFVLNDYDELCGYVPDRNLIINSHDLSLRQVMQPILHTVTPDTHRDEVVDIMERYEIASLPVVDSYDQLVGVIPFEEAVEAMKDIMDDTIASIAGTAEDFDEQDPLIQRFFWRAPWLIVTVMAGLINATSLGLFQGYSWFVFVPFFVPLIAGLSGNVGIQCSTLLVRSLASGEATYRTLRQILLREISIGLLIGLVFGISCGVLVYLLSSFGADGALAVPPLSIAMTVSMGVLGACLASSFLGSFSPFIFARVGIDPAVAAGPIVTAFNDVMSAWIFILIAYVVGFFLL